MKTYCIKRFYGPEVGRPPETIKTGLTFEEAREHCDKAETSGDGWFDGFYEEES